MRGICGVSPPTVLRSAGTSPRIGGFTTRAAFLPAAPYWAPTRPLSLCGDPSLNVVVRGHVGRPTPATGGPSRARPHAHAHSPFRVVALSGVGSKTLSRPAPCVSVQLRCAPLLPADLRSSEETESAKRGRTGRGDGPSGPGVPGSPVLTFSSHKGSDNVNRNQLNVSVLPPFVVPPRTGSTSLTGPLWINKGPEGRDVWR